ncbi:CDP-alcohol phosphatidyltransferase family protein [Luteimonas yindakuii]|uniref:CDP-alcohol phosphatidyltransferase family protein n=1 Tax=Luteimonas yindakuii TaxID=2565782 RepID=UPI0010A4C026|nr:CDP-alcohol phosphatidyltransferase family protein [Luteimonas yindakuii]QCO66892.1 CDP-alcohol phosphatidyltransferase family protein [Luteimonas yindakuii]
MSIYGMKGRFQLLLRPLARRVARAGMTANQVTLMAAGVSLVVAWVVYRQAGSHPLLYLLLPGWMLIRMALNAIDGMLAREFAQQSSLGAYLNELCDAISDAALYLCLLGMTGINGTLLWTMVLAAVLTEYAGVLGLMVGASRRYDGPMGKSDRALVIGVLGVVLAAGWAGPRTVDAVSATVAVLCAVTVYRRIAKGLAETHMHDDLQGG